MNYMMYSVNLNKKGIWIVENTFTGEVQSCWKSRWDAINVCRDLNAVLRHRF